MFIFIRTAHIQQQPHMDEFTGLDHLIDIAIREDVGDGDHSTLACIPFSAKGKAQMIAKQEGILCGIDVAARVFKRVDPELTVDIKKHDGESTAPREVLLTVSGSSASILTAERTALNFIQRMSGIATQTHAMVRLLDGLHTRLLDTRKTTPGLRLLEKYAVHCGGGTNHRIGLYDMIMLKDNHIDFAGGITQAIDRTRDYLTRTGRDLKIEIEVRNLDELQQVLAHGGVQRIMLDNFDTATLAKAVALIDHRYETEASGGITRDTLRQYAETGVDFISVGALTHHIKSLDISLISL